MRKFSFGVELHAYHDARTTMREIEAAEELGYDHVWLGDSQLIWRDLYVLLGAAAKMTTRVILGTGVTNPKTRHAAVTASAIVTLHELSGGRVILGVGTGDSAVKTVGLKPSTRAELEEFVQQVRTFCRGQKVRGAAGNMHLIFGSDEKCPSVIVGGSGPKMLKLAGRIGDGVILAGGAKRSEVVKKMLECVDEGRRERIQRTDGFEVFVALSACVDSERRRAIAAVRPNVARGLLRPQFVLSPAASTAREKLREVYNYYEHMSPTARHADLIPDEVVPDYAIVGTPSECVQQVAQLFDLGIDQITIRPYGAAGAPRMTTIKRFAEEVMKPFSQTRR